ncbi:DUF397 domain-containing protein [Actinophytocola algeriensis]|nr:DUF397 domain-containing protein [Actinophytocola algeriensis]
MSWRKSSFSGNLSCVEVACLADGRLIRDSKDPGETLRFPWRSARRLFSFVGQREVPTSTIQK